MAEYIEREAAYEKCGWYNTVNGKSVCAVRKDELAVIPAADVAPVVHGRWEHCGFGKEVMCSVCRCELDDGWMYRHCPDCGARMDGE